MCCYSGKISKVQPVTPWFCINGIHRWHFAWNIQIFLDKLFHKTAQNHRISNYYCFHRASQGQLSQCYRRNHVLKAVVKFHKGVKGIKVFAFWVFCNKSQNFIKINRKEPLLWSFYCRAVAWNSLSKNQSKGYSEGNFIKRDAYTETLTQVFSCTFWKNYKHDFERLCETASEIMSKKEFVI